MTEQIQPQIAQAVDHRRSQGQTMSVTGERPGNLQARIQQAGGEQRVHTEKSG